jgi:hypothetical protein
MLSFNPLLLQDHRNVLHNKHGLDSESRPLLVFLLVSDQNVELLDFRRLLDSVSNDESIFEIPPHDMPALSGAGRRIVLTCASSCTRNRV